MKFLVVDDSKVLIKRISAHLSSLGHEVVGQGNDGYQGAELFQRLKPDAVLLDVTMPNRDGRDCLIDILKLDPKACVIMLSATKSEEVINDCKSLGARDFINKDDLIDINIFGENLKKALGLTRAA
ncbi:MAG: response regulator [Bdellovibrionales bacterium]|nr:response regulator [Bdellovibrionales bacterium]